MRTHSRVLIAATTLGLVLGGCTDDAQDRPGVSTAIGDEPLTDDEVTLHLMEAPPLPPELDASEYVTSELRSDDLTERHTVEVVAVPTDVSAVAVAPEAGAFYLVAEGATLEVGQDVDTAALGPAEAEESSAITAVTEACPAPCSVVGPALVGAAGWMNGFGVEPTWVLLVPSPIA